MEWDFPAGVALPDEVHDQQVARAQPLVWHAPVKRRLFITLGVLANLFLATFITMVVVARDPGPPVWVFVTLGVVVNGALILSAWTDQRPFAELRGWQLTARSGLSRTKTVDLRLARRGTLRRYNGALYFLLRFHRVTGHPRKLSLPADGQQLRQAVLARLDMLPGLATSGWLRDTIVTHRTEAN